MIPAGYHTPVKKKRGSFVGGPIPFDNVPSKYTKRFFFANALGVVLWRHLITVNVNISLLQKRNSIWISPLGKRRALMPTTLECRRDFLNRK